MSTGIDCKDKILINYIEELLNDFGIEYMKSYSNGRIVIYNEPFLSEGFVVRFNCKNIRYEQSVNKTIENFKAKREHLEKCLSLV